jgi:lysophospholipase L1-like esterase
MKKKLVKYIKISVITVSILTVAAELILRSSPEFIPYPYTVSRDYDTHYVEMVKALEEPEYLERLSPNVIVIGDSLTRGVALPVGNDWPALLRKKNKIALFNLGVGGTSTFEQKLLLETAKLPKSTKTVLLNIYHNDILQNEIDIQNYEQNGPYLFAHRHINQTQKLEHECTYSGPFKNSLGLFGRFCLLETIRNLRLRLSFGASEKNRRINDVFDNISQTHISKRRDFSNYPHLKNFKEINRIALSKSVLIVSSIKKFLGKKNITLLVTYTPSKDEIYVEDWKVIYDKPQLPITSFGTQLQSYMKKSKVLFFDLTELYRESRVSEAPIFFDRDDHMNSAGHRLAARLIAPFISKHSKP